MSHSDLRALVACSQLVWYPGGGAKEDGRLELKKMERRMGVKEDGRGGEAKENGKREG